MEFILQKDNVCRAEKNAVITASYLRDDILVKFASLSDVRDGEDPRKEFTPVGTVEFCKAWMEKCDIQIPRPIDYPLCFRRQGYVHHLMGREVELCFYSEVPEKMWVKPFHTKEFEPHIIGVDPYRMDLYRKNPLVWFQKPIKFVAEWRCYIMDGELQGYTRYDDNEAEFPFSANYVTPFLLELNREFTDRKMPVSYGLDIGLLENGRILFIEINDAWALGYYPKNSISQYTYATMLHSRWNQILGEQ